MKSRIKAAKAPKAEEKTVHLAPPHPYVFRCPHCAEPEYGSLQIPLRFGYSMSEQWGCVVTRHDFSKCPNCKDTFVSTNGADPELAADQYRIRKSKKGQHKRRAE